MNSKEKNNIVNIEKILVLLLNNNKEVTTATQLSKFLPISVYMIEKVARENAVPNILFGDDAKKLNRQIGKQLQQQTILEKYGSIENYNTQVKIKKDNTLIKNYGSIENYNSIKLNKTQNTLVNKYGSVDNAYRLRKEKEKNTLLSRYGVEHNSCIKKVIDKRKQTYANKSEEEKLNIITKRNKTISNTYGSVKLFRINQQYKSAQTKLKKYNCAYYNNHAKTEQTNLLKYGVKNQYQRPEIQNKIKETNLSRYGTKYYTQSIDYKHKSKYTLSNKTNAEKQNAIDKYKNTCLKKYNVPYYCLSKKCIKSRQTRTSKPNMDFANILEKNNLKFSAEYRLDTKLFDFKVDDTLIEINPTATHNSTWGIFTPVGLDKNYHHEKTKLALTNNFKCIHIFDWDNVDKIIEIILTKKSKIYARNCEIKLIDNTVCDTFLNMYHLQCTCKNQTIKLGLYYNNELIQVMTFGKPRYNKKYEYELLRLCTKAGYISVGGAEKLFNYFIKNYNPSTIISYCDNSKFNGNIYKKIGFNLDTYGNPSKHWYNIKTKKHITDNLLRQRGFDQLFNTNYGKGTSNEDLMRVAGFVEIYDCGQSTYVYTNNKV